LVPGAPDIDYLATIEISNKSEVKTTLSLDKFPAFEGYISINGGRFNSLYQYKSVLKNPNGPVQSSDFNGLLGSIHAVPSLIK
jgi:hypothetical protein